MIFYEANPGQLVPQAGSRVVNTFASGLVRVDQTYSCVTEDAASLRDSLAVGSPMPDGDEYPSSDGLFIHPEPQEVVRADGFTDFKISAYGRMKDEFSGITLSQTTAYGSARIATIPEPTFVNVYVIFFLITGKIIKPFGEILEMKDLIYDSTLIEPQKFSRTPQGPPLEFSRINDNTFNVDLGYSEETTFVFTDPYFGINSQTNFGNMVEIDVTISRGTTETIPS